MKVKILSVANEANLTIDELQQLESKKRFILDRKGAIAFSKEQGKREGREEGKRELIISLIESLLGELDVDIKNNFNQVSSYELNVKFSKYI